MVTKQCSLQHRRLCSVSGNVYECTFAHTSNSGWTPTEAFTLWKLRSDLVAGEIETTTKEEVL